ncbi:unnamed protein product, partial [marine sediment metagenome]
PSQIIDPVRYWQAWFVIQGGQALLNVIIGLTLIIIGSRYFVIKEQ